MSAGESESESETELIEQIADVAETPYIHMPEDEFGAVSLILQQVGANLILTFLSGWRTSRRTRWGAQKLDLVPC